MGSKLEKMGKLIRLDGWGNILTGLGIKGRDKRLGAEAAFANFPEQEIEALYSADSMAKKIVNKLPEDMFREGYRLVSPTIDDEVLREAEAMADALIIRQDGNLFVDALQWARAYGGSGLILGTDDTDDEFDGPLELDKIKNLEWVALLNRFELVPHTINGDPRALNFGQPETYLLSPRSAHDTRSGKNHDKSFSNTALHTTEVHWSRVIKFDGSKLLRRQYIQNHYWHDSILNSIQGDIRDYQASYSSASALILDFAQAIYKIKNLADIISSPDGIEIIERRIAIVDRCRSVLRAALVDADGEDFERKSTSLAGLDKTLDKLSRKFTSATEYPHTVLLGEAPGGQMGGTGESEKRDYEDYIRAQQNAYLKPRLMRFFTVIFSAKDGPTKGQVPDDFDIEFNPIRVLNQKETLEAREKQAKTDQIYIVSGVLDPVEVGLSRFGAGEYSFETEINTDLRKEPTEIGKDDPEDKTSTPGDDAGE